MSPLGPPSPDTCEGGDEEVSRSHSHSRGTLPSYSNLPTTTVEGEALTAALPNETAFAKNSDISGEEYPAASEHAHAEGDEGQDENGHNVTYYESPALSSDGDDSEASNTPSLIKRAARSLTSKGLYEAYKIRLQTKPHPMFNPPLNFFPRRKGVDDNASQASNLVKGMVDYMRVLENRITDLESRNYDTASMGGDPDNRRQSTQRSGLKMLSLKPSFLMREFT